MIKRYLRKQILEIEQSFSLRLYGFFLAVVHILTYTFWSPYIEKVLADQASPFCWPFFTTCHTLHILPEALTEVLFKIYLLVAIGTSGLFLSGHFRKQRLHLSLAYFLLLALNFVKLFILLQDYQFMGNYHYMPFWVSFVYLFIPQKRVVLPWLLALFYFGAGLLKLNFEWLSGSALGRGPEFLQSLRFVSADWVLQVACAYVVFLELIFVWGLFVRRLRILTLFQLLIFHAVSWNWVSYYYPSNMLCLLSLFPMIWHENPRETKVFSKLGMVALGLFLLLQLIPKFLSSDAALDGRLRLASLNMFDARTQCFNTILLRYEKETVEYAPTFDHFGVRIHCDPIVFLATMNNICRAQNLREDFIDADLYLITKRATETNYQPILKMENYCRSHYGK